MISQSANPVLLLSTFFQAMMYKSNVIARNPLLLEQSFQKAVSLPMYEESFHKV